MESGREVSFVASSSTGGRATTAGGGVATAGGGVVTAGGRAATAGDGATTAGDGVAIGVDADCGTTFSTAVTCVEIASPPNLSCMAMVASLTPGGVIPCAAAISVYVLPSR